MGWLQEAFWNFINLDLTPAWKWNGQPCPSPSVVGSTLASLLFCLVLPSAADFDSFSIHLADMALLPFFASKASRVTGQT